MTDTGTPKDDVLCHGTWSHEPVEMVPVDEKGNLSCPTCGTVVLRE